MPNRLAQESSPYLRQHADNPVEWYPWGAEAFARAVAEDRPVLLSIGYSACHWCHVMAHESFEDASVAALMNQHFVNVKVDREEHPDVDQVYQQALSLFGEHGGWPLTMFLTPRGAPFFGGTYFPPAERFGRPSFRRLLQSIAQAWKDDRAEIDDQAGQVLGALRQHQERAPQGEPTGQLPRDYAQRAAARLLQRVDTRLGGFAGAPKFPNPTALALMLRAYGRSGDLNDAHPVLLTLDRMAEGGIYDQLGGGFHRYSTDAQWLVPHFEKMLYDNGLLLRLYAEGWQIARAAGQAERAARYEHVLRDTAAWLEREMRAPDGGLYAAQDADSEGVEGKYFVWTPEQAEEVCGAEAAAVIRRCLDVKPGGNWNDPHGHGPQGASILHVVDRPRGEAEERLFAEGTARMLAARQRRVPPGTDDKVLSGWNGLAMSGLCEAGRVLGDAGLVAAGQRTADFLLQRMRPGGRLQRTYKDGQAKLPATLDDLAFVAEGLYHLAGASGEARYLQPMRELVDQVLAEMYDPQRHAFYLAPPEAPEGGVAAPVRPVSLHDSAIPSGLSVTCLNLLRLRSLLPPEEGTRYLEIAEAVLRRQAESGLRSPFGLSNLCSAVDLWQHGVCLVEVHGPGADGLRRAACQTYVPDPFIRAAPGGDTAATVCMQGRCAAPVHEPAALVETMQSMNRGGGSPGFAG